MIRMIVKEQYVDRNRTINDGTEVDVISIEPDDTCYSKFRANCIIYVSRDTIIESDICLGLLLENMRGKKDYNLESRRILRLIKKAIKENTDPLKVLKISTTSQKFGI